MNVQRNKVQELGSGQPVPLFSQFPGSTFSGKKYSFPKGLILSGLCTYVYEACSILGQKGQKLK